MVKRKDPNFKAVTWDSDFVVCSTPKSETAPLLSSTLRLHSPILLESRERGVLPFPPESRERGVLPFPPESRERGGEMSGLEGIKKQASFFFQEQIRTARLALTDVTPVQLLTEEATSANSSAPDAKTMRVISRASFEIDDYCRIVAVLHRRLAKFEKNQWREPYNSLVLLEHLLTHGPERIADEFQSLKGTAQEMCKFQFVDEKGFNWGLVVKKKSEKVLKLLEKGQHFREERERARRISREIQGFGSFNQNSTSCNAISITHEDASIVYGRSISLYEDHSCIKEGDEKENQKLGLDDKLNLRGAEKESEPFIVPRAGAEAGTGRGEGVKSEKGGK